MDLSDNANWLVMIWIFFELSFFKEIDPHFLLTHLSLSRSLSFRPFNELPKSIVSKKFASVATHSKNVLRFRLKETTYCSSYDYTLYTLRSVVDNTREDKKLPRWN